MNMNQKGFANIILIVLVVILAGAVGYFALVKKPVSPTPTSQVNIKGSEFIPPDSGVVDLLVISVSKGHYCSPKNTVSVPAGEVGVPTKPVVTKNESCPSEGDSGVVKVEKIISYDRYQNPKYKRLEEGKVYNSSFISRPAKFKYLLQPAKETVESGFQAIENGFYVFAFYTGGSLTKEHEVILPGFKEGDKIRAQINFFDGNLDIKGYELLK